jgi:sugar lactone lactonase YvrE
LLGAGALAGLIVLAQRGRVKSIVQMGALAVFIALSLMTLRTAWIYNYVNYDNVVEFGMYAHGAPGLKIALAEIEELSRRVTGDPHQIEVLYDNEATWPWLWYLRDFPNKRYINSSPSRSDASLPVLILSDMNWSAVDQTVGNNYNSFRLQRIWWPMEDYKRIDEIVCPTAVTQPDGSVLRYAAYDENEDGVIDPSEQAAGDARCRQHFRDLLPALWNIFFWRDYNLYGKLTGQTFTPQEWPLRADFRLYVRKDMAAKVWDQAVGLIDGGEVSPPTTTVGDTYRAKWRDVSALRTIGSAGQGDGQLLSPHGVAVAPDGSIYVADSANYRIVKFNAEGEHLFSFGTWSGAPPNGDSFSPNWNPPAGTFSDPWGVAVGPDGSVYVADLGAHRIQKFDANGQPLKTWGGFSDTGGRASGAEGSFWGPRGIAVGPDGRVYVADTGNKRVQVFDADGEFLFQFGGGGLLDNNLDEPVGVAVTDDGALVVADTWNGRVQVFDADSGQSLRRWNVEGWYDPSVDDLGRNRVGKPYLGAAPDGRVYVADQTGNQILVFGSTGEYLGAFGRLGSDDFSFSAPSGVAFDASGNVLVVDTGNNRVMVFPPLAEAEAPAEE